MLATIEVPTVQEHRAIECRVLLSAQVLLETFEKVNFRQHSTRCEDP